VSALWDHGMLNEINGTIAHKTRNWSISALSAGDTKSAVTGLFRCCQSIHWGNRVRPVRPIVIDDANTTIRRPWNLEISVEGVVTFSLIFIILNFPKSFSWIKETWTNSSFYRIENYPLPRLSDPVFADTLRIYEWEKEIKKEMLLERSRARFLLMRYAFIEVHLDSAWVEVVEATWPFNEETLEEMAFRRFAADCKHSTFCYTIRSSRLSFCRSLSCSFYYYYYYHYYYYYTTYYDHSSRHNGSDK